MLLLCATDGGVQGMYQKVKKARSAMNIAHFKVREARQELTAAKQKLARAMQCYRAARARVAFVEAEGSYLSPEPECPERAERWSPCHLHHPALVRANLDCVDLRWKAMETRVRKARKKHEDAQAVLAAAKQRHVEACGRRCTT